MWVCRDQPYLASNATWHSKAGLKQPLKTPHASNATITPLRMASDQFVRTLPLKFGLAYYPTYGATPILQDGKIREVVFLYPGIRNGGVYFDNMEIVPVNPAHCKSKQELWNDLQPYIKSHAYAWYLEMRNGDRSRNADQLREQPGHLAQFWEHDVLGKAGQQCPSPEEIRNYNQNKDHILAWVLKKWWDTLEAHVMDPNPQQEMPYLPFADRDLQMAFAKLQEGENTGFSLKKLQTKEEITAEIIRDVTTQANLTPALPAGIRTAIDTLKQQTDVAGVSFADRLKTLEYQLKAGSRWQGCDEMLASIQSAHKLLSKMKNAKEGDFYARIKVDPENLAKGGGFRYLVRIDNSLLPDPWAVRQPQDVHGPSESMNMDFSWGPQATQFWHQPKHLGRLMMQQVHVGTFTREGTFKAAKEKLQELKRMGKFEYTGIQFNPLCEFPGHNSWGYDGVNYFAVENAYGPPQDLQELVKWCHQNDIAVVFDMVLNHMGAEGNSLNRFGGGLFNKDGGNGLGGSYEWNNPEAVGQAKQAIGFWIENYHADGIRYDMGQWIPEHARRAINDYARHRKPNIILIDEDYEFKNFVTWPATRQTDKHGNVKLEGGLGLNAQYSEPLWKHGYKPLLESQAHNRANRGTLNQYFHALWDGLPHDNERRPLESGLTYLEHHDITNNEWGSRLIKVMRECANEQEGVKGRGYDIARMGAVLHQLMPGPTLSQQGADDARETPFHFFTSNLSDLNVAFNTLMDRGKQGKSEFRNGGPGCLGPDAFQQSKMTRPDQNWREDYNNTYSKLFMKALQLRKEYPAFWQGGRAELSFDGFFPNEGWRDSLRDNNIMLVHRKGRSGGGGWQIGGKEVMFTPQNEGFVVANFSDQPKRIGVPFPGGAAGWTEVLNTDNRDLGGKGLYHGPQSAIEMAPTLDKQGVMMELPPRTLIVYAKGDQGVPKLAGPTVNIHASPRFKPFLPTPSQRKMMQNNFAVLLA
ncbi:MAG TPA: alpha-amylase family glycosyl hydrolase [Coleofasciculaceae cyanobacterium]|jgi:maltooligosyltrehalose trehalohydrolase